MEDKNKVITVIDEPTLHDFNKEIICWDCSYQPSKSVRPKFIRKKYPVNYPARHLIVDPEAVISCSNCQHDFKQPHWIEVIVCPQYNEKSGGRKKEPDYLIQQSSRIDIISEKHATVIIFGVEIDIRKIKDKAYFVKKAYEILSHPNVPLEADAADAFQWRISLIRCLEYLLGTEFKNTRDFKEKVRGFLKRVKGGGIKGDKRTARELKAIMETAGQRIIKARKKIGWSQERLAKYLAFKSKGTIANYEKDTRYPPERVFKWLKNIEGLTKKEAQEWAKKEAVKA